MDGGAQTLWPPLDSGVLQVVRVQKDLVGGVQKPGRRVLGREALHTGLTFTRVICTSAPVEVAATFVLPWNRNRSIVLRQATHWHRIAPS